MYFTSNLFTQQRCLCILLLLLAKVQQKRGGRLRCVGSAQVAMYLHLVGQTACRILMDELGYFSQWLTRLDGYCTRTSQSLIFSGSLVRKPLMQGPTTATQTFCWLLLSLGSSRLLKKAPRDSHFREPFRIKHARRNAKREPVGRRNWSKLRSSALNPTSWPPVSLLAMSVTRSTTTLLYAVK